VHESLILATHYRARQSELCSRETTISTHDRDVSLQDCERPFRRAGMLRCALGPKGSAAAPASKSELSAERRRDRFLRVDAADEDDGSLQVNVKPSAATPPPGAVIGVNILAPNMYPR
jgi:hypothetical protein